jgi:UDP-GlcNAc:undecaprenyl-phosphate/decaprenyl-phosphate GlcNAc-1-phosphate transferase
MRLTPGVGEALPLLIAAFAGAALLALALTPVVRDIAIRIGMVDEPEGRRVSTRPVPRAGGIATMTAFVLVALLAIGVNDQLAIVPWPALLDRPQLIALLAGGVAAALMGLIDDYLQIRARWQLVGQFLLAGWAVALGIGVGSINDPLGPGSIRIEGWIGVVVTVFWIVGMINSVNFIDGLDGLSTGIGLIAAVTLGFISLTTTVGQPFIALLCFTLAGALLGFLRWNFHPASVFAGTSGVLFLGYTLALLSILGTAKVAVALLVLGVPIIDTFWIIVRRIATGGTPFSPDRGHIHHRLLDLGLTHTQAVVLIYAMCVGLAGLSLVLSGTGQLYAFLGLFVLSGLGLFVLARRSLVAEELSAASYDTSDVAGAPVSDDGSALPTAEDPAVAPTAEDPAVAPGAEDPAIAPGDER